MRQRSIPPWITRLRNAYEIQNVVALRPELPFYLVRWDGKRGIDWMELGDPHYRPMPFHFEIHFGKEAVRDSHYLTALKRAAESGEVVLKQLFGFWDLFYRLPIRGRERAFLFAGQFLREPPEWETLAGSWRNLSGHDAASADPDFGQFVRMALGLPVLEPELLAAISEFVRLYAAFLAGTEPDVAARIDAVNRERISKLWPVDDLVDSVISPDKFRLPPWHYEGSLTDWMREGMGIDKLPTTAMALMPLDSRTEALDPLQSLVRNARIQRAGIAFARELPRTAATRLRDYGVSLITSSERGASEARARQELRARAQTLCSFVAKRFGVTAVVGIGRRAARGAPLYESHREAVLALHMCVQLGKSVLFYDEHGAAKVVGYRDLQRAADALNEALQRESSAALKLASDDYVHCVLRYANERTEVARGQLLAMLFRLLATVQRRNPMRADVRDRFAGALTQRLELAHSIDQILESFNEALQRLALVFSEAWQGPGLMRVEATLQYLKDNFFEDLPLPVVARRAGFSVPAFTRIFRQATGSSYLAYLRAVRVAHARKLLTTTELNIEQIAQECGFCSQHHLIRSFKKELGQTPGAYRKEHAEAPGSA